MGSNSEKQQMHVIEDQQMELSKVSCFPGKRLFNRESYQRDNAKRQDSN